MTTVDDLPEAYIERSDTPTVLIIEDDMTTIKLIKFTAEHMGWSILPVLSTEELSAIEHTDNFDLIISDDNIIGGNVLDTMAILKGIGCNAPMVLISAAEDDHLQSMMDKGQEMGLKVVGYMKKPFQMQDLSDLLQSHMPNTSAG